MIREDNFKWLVNDIDNTLVLKVIYKKDSVEETYGVFNVKEVLETSVDELEVQTGNINDLTNLLTFGRVLFVNYEDNADILDIPFRNLYLLYKNAHVLGEDDMKKPLSFSELDAFSVIDGTVRNDCLVMSARINNVSSQLDEIMKIAYEFGSYSMQEKFDALSKITYINHQRVVSDEKEKTLKQ